MTDTEQHHAALRELNRNYIRSVDEADVAWFDANLAEDFCNTNPDGSLIDRKAFLAQIGRGSSVKNIREHDVQDFDAALPSLDAAQRAWLRAAIAVVHPGHPWLERLG